MKEISLINPSSVHVMLTFLKTILPIGTTNFLKKKEGGRLRF
jgi:hypothetical protein